MNAIGLCRCDAVGASASEWAVVTPTASGSDVLLAFRDQPWELASVGVAGGLVWAATVWVAARVAGSVG